jgi:hypothetical protein
MPPIHRTSAIALFLSLSTSSICRATPPDISPLSEAAKTAMTGKAWNPGCPVRLEDLVAVTVKYVGFDGATHDGIIVIHKRFADDVSAIFKELYAIKFPIHTVSTYENYEVGKSGYSDATVGFYCRKAQDAPTEWSGHAYGAAVDINPLENPFLDAKDGWWPEGTAAMAPRDGGKGKASPSTEALRIFASHGWAWGGFYIGEPDYMHFYKLTVGAGNPLERHYVVNRMDFLPEGGAVAATPGNLK